MLKPLWANGWKQNCLDFERRSREPIQNYDARDNCVISWTIPKSLSAFVAWNIPEIIDPFLTWTSTGSPIKHVVKYTSRSRDELSYPPPLVPVKTPVTMTVTRKKNQHNTKNKVRFSPAFGNLLGFDFPDCNLLSCLLPISLRRPNPLAKGLGCATCCRFILRRYL